MFAPLIIITMWMGIYPSSFLDPMSASVGQLVHNYHVALDEAATASKLAQR